MLPEPSEELRLGRFSELSVRPAGLGAGMAAQLVKVNPITLLVDATRALMVGGSVAPPLVTAIAWMAAITLMFAPHAIRSYRRRTWGTEGPDRVPRLRMAQPHESGC